MNLFLFILKVIVIILFGITIFFFLLYHASGHDIPNSTNLFFLLMSITLIVLYILINYISKKKITNNKEAKILNDDF